MQLKKPHPWQDLVLLLYHLVEGFHHRRMKVCLKKRACRAVDARLFSFQSADAAPNRYVFPFEEPHCSPKNVTAMGTVNMMGKCVLTVVGPPLSGPGLQVGPADHFLLYLHEKLARDDGLVASFHVILRDDALVDHSLLIQEVRGDCLLQKRIADIFFIGQDLFQGAG